MKKLILKPGFEAIFALSIIAIIGLPPLVFGQNKKEVTETKHFDLTINNGDTVVNGKNLKDLKGKEREEALASINGHTENFGINQNRIYRITYRRRNNKTDSLGKTAPEDMVMERSIFPAESYAFVDGSNKRIKGVTYERRSDRDDDAPLGIAPRRTMSFRLTGEPGELESRNTQNFSYESTDGEGISTHISYRVGDASKEKLKSIAAAEKAELAIRDISLTPEFSTGKTNLSFNLPAKTSAEIQFKDSQGNVLWSDKTSTGSFSKNFSLGLNGAYYLQVKQGGNVALKRIVKED